MSRMSALTTFRLIGSPTNPGCPYWRPCSDCLSVARDMPTGGVGTGAAAEVCWATTPAAERHASDRTSAILLMADLTRDWKDIVPSLGKFQTCRHALRSIAGATKARAALTRQRFDFCQKGAGVLKRKHQRRSTV